MNAGNDSYTRVSGAPFDGTIMPIAYIPDWTRSANQDKSKRFEDISISEYLPIPLYDPLALLDTSGWRSATLLRYTYTSTYMGNYKLDYREHVGWHLGVDIRAPIGTPVLAIANWVIVRTVEADATGNKFIVIRHDKVPISGKPTSIYSWYLHLSEILVREGDPIRKGDMIGRVGITGITTTPHLHLQIDTADAPFHPYWHFTSAESREAWVSFYDAINTGLHKEKAEKYTLHPMLFINTYLWWTPASQTVTIPLASDTRPPEASTQKDAPTPIQASATTTQTTIASYVSDNCIGKRFTDVAAKSSFGKVLYPLVDKKCLFEEAWEKLDSKGIITYREALINTMRYFDIVPASGTSHFLDIPLWDSLQWYALIAYRRGILSGSHAYPEHIMTREELAHLIITISKKERNPSQIRIYNDVDTLNPHYTSIQDYAYLARARGGKFYPKTLVTRGMLVQMLANIREKN
jgi:murein DD-endopeptidase MepM/ murein hydrolase activator NlpD